jgi:hypothetical protein
MSKSPRAPHVFLVVMPALVTCSSQDATVLRFADGSGTPVSTDTGTTLSALPFSDDFSQGYAKFWQTSSGDGPVTDAAEGGNSLVVLDATANDFSRLRCNAGGDRFTAQDLTASMRVRIERAPSSSRTVRLDVRQSATSQNIFYAAGATVNKKDGFITSVGVYKKVDDGTGTKSYALCDLATAALGPTIPLGTWFTLKIAINGSTSAHLVASIESAGTSQTVTHTDDCRSTLTSTADDQIPNGGCLNGQAGLGIQVEGEIKASVDDVRVEAL